MLCLFKAQYVHYEGNNLQQKGDEYTVKRLYLFAPCRKHREYRTIQSIKTGPSVSFFYFMNACVCMCVFLSFLPFRGASFRCGDSYLSRLKERK